MTIFFQGMSLAPQDKNTIKRASDHPHSRHISRVLDDLLIRAWDEKQLKAEYIAVSVGSSRQAMTNYRTGKRPIPLDVAARIDLFLGVHDMWIAMANMEGIRGLSQEAS